MIRHALICAALAGFAAVAHADESRYCEIAIDFSLNGKLVASPSAIVTYGEDADVTVGDPAEHAWRFHILAEAPTVVRRVNAIPVSIEVYEIAEGKEFARASPHLKLAPGQRADFDTTFGNGDGRKVHLALAAKPKSEAEIEALKRSDNGAQ
jgi:hypothetical protein